MNKIGVIGAGKWGSALAFAFAKDSEVFVWSRTKKDGHSPIELVLDSKYLVISIASQYIDTWFANSYTYKKDQLILIASKGIDKQSGLFLNEIIAKYAPVDSTVFLSGPSFAHEVLQGLPTALTLSSTSSSASSEWASLFPSFIKTYTSLDVIGAEIGGAYKNVIAIASGICEGLGLGQNARAALITRGLAEMTRFGMAFGADLTSFLGLGGVGDLLLSATSQSSRNYRVGLALAVGKTLDQALYEVGETAEGVDTAYAIVKICNKNSIYAPIASEVASILNGKKPKDSINALLASSNKSEFY